MGMILTFVGFRSDDHNTRKMAETTVGKWLDTTVRINVTLAGFATV